MLTLLTSASRAARPLAVKFLILGYPKVGKTTLIQTLPEDTVYIGTDPNGDGSIGDWGGLSLHPETWPDIRDAVLAACGPLPNADASSPYSEEAYRRLPEELRDSLQTVNHVYIDSMTSIGRRCLQWAKPQCTDRKGDPDTRAAYGMVKEELEGLLDCALSCNKHVIFTAVIADAEDNSGRPFKKILIPGGTASEILNMVDQIFTLVAMPEHDGKRALVSREPNKWQVPAGDRYGAFAKGLVKPDLGEAIAEIRAAKTADAS